MATYATVTELRGYSDQVSGADTDPDLEKLLVRAERDVDFAAGAWPISDATTGLKFDPAALSAYQKAALSRATCAQAEYRHTMGEEFMVKAQHSRVSGPDFTVDGELPYVGPKVLRELASGGLLRGGPGVGYASVPMSAVRSRGGIVGNL